MSNPRFRQFEEVLVTMSAINRGREIEDRLSDNDQLAVVVWCDESHIERLIYVVHIPALNCYLSVGESDLVSTGVIHDAAEYTGKGFEISFDLLLDAADDVVQCMEGCLRTPGTFWQAFFIWHLDVPSTKIRRGFARSGIEMIVCDVPETTPITKAFILETLGQTVGTSQWVEVNGPDSLMLK